MMKKIRPFLTAVMTAAYLLTAVVACRPDGPVQNEYISVEGVALNIAGAELAKGDTMRLVSVILPYGTDASDLSIWDESVRDRIMWKSDNVKVAVVSQEGMVTAVGEGTCSVSFVCGMFSASCKVTVRDIRKEKLFGLWISGTDSLFLDYGDSWSFDGMRLNLPDRTMIVTAVEKGILSYHEPDSATIQNMHMAAVPVTLSQLEEHSLTADGFKAVDLGLSDGLLWAPCNLGAQTPADMGMTLAWAETEPKDSYFLENYKWYDNSKYEMFKYTYQGIDGMPSFSFDMEDDAANQYLGGGWHTPSFDEMSELLSDCGCFWSTLEGTAGILLVNTQEGMSGAKLFLPFTDSGYNDPAHRFGSYWTSTIAKYNEFEAFYLSVSWNQDAFSESYCNLGTAKRYSPIAVRPVCKR